MVLVGRLGLRHLLGLAHGRGPVTSVGGLSFGSLLIWGMCQTRLIFTSEVPAAGPRTASPGAWSGGAALASSPRVRSPKKESTCADAAPDRVWTGSSAPEVAVAQGLSGIDLVVSPPCGRVAANRNASAHGARRANRIIWPFCVTSRFSSASPDLASSSSTRRRAIMCERRDSGLPSGLSHALH